MSKERMTNAISLIAIIFALIVSIFLFTVLNKEGQSYEKEYFSKEDIEDVWNEGKTHYINLSEYENYLIIEDGGYYELSGEMQGQVVIKGNSQSVYFIRLNGINISNKDGACLLVENANKVILELKEGSQNTIYMGSNSEEESIDGAIYSKDDLTIKGAGSLEVSGDYSHGIVCNDKLVISGSSVTINAKTDGIHANDLIALREVDINISAGDDGITVKNDEETGIFYGESGKVQVEKCYEGIEASEIIIIDGEYNLFPMDDGVNAMVTVNISGGKIKIENQGGNDVDGIDSNGDILISGGDIFISLPQGAMNEPIDYGEESGGTLEIDGGNIEAYVGDVSVDVNNMSGQSFGGGFDNRLQGNNGDRLPEMEDRFNGTPPEMKGDIKEAPPNMGKGFDSGFEKRGPMNEEDTMMPPVGNRESKAYMGIILIICAITLIIGFVVALLKKSRVNLM